jgi:radical SAM superfamily enzyme YgiQ (UPF0313 family)
MSKIHVHPVSLGPNRTSHIEIFTAFYSLGCLTAYAKAHEDGRLRESFEFSPITPRPERDLPQLFDQLPGEPGVFLLSSYVWNHVENMRFARELKERRPGSIVIVGGPHVPRAEGPCEQFFADHPYVDVAVRHEGEVTLAELLSEVARDGIDPQDLSRIDFSSVAGVTFRQNGTLVRTPDRGRTMELGLYPSPYLTGEFDHWIDDKVYLPLETNRGCPYGCTFCDWGAATLSKIGRMTMDRVLGDVEFAARHRAHTIGFCDANFGILARDVDIVRFIIEMKDKYGYPKEVGYTNAKTASSRLTDVIKLLRDAGLTSTAQISMQTTDEQILKNVERSNIKMTEYRKMIAFFHELEIPAVSDIMLGLPGQTFETCKKDLQFCFDHKVLAVIFATSVMPNAPMADAGYREKFKLVMGADGFVESTYSFTREQYAEMFDLCIGYKFFVKLGILKYLLYVAQIDHGLKAMDFVARWLQVTASDTDQYPISRRVRRELLERDYRGGLKDWLVLVWSDQQAAFLFDNLDAFHREVIEFIENEHGVRLAESDIDAVLTANREVMPRKGREIPARVALSHDVAGYFAYLRKLPRIDELPDDYVSLANRGPGYLDLPPQPPTTSYHHVDAGPLLAQLEQASNLRI